MFTTTISIFPSITNASETFPLSASKNADVGMKCAFSGSVKIVIVPVKPSLIRFEKFSISVSTWNVFVCLSAEELMNVKFDLYSSPERNVTVTF